MSPKMGKFASGVYQTEKYVRISMPHSAPRNLEIRLDYFIADLAATCENKAAIRYLNVFWDAPLWNCLWL